MPTQKQKKLGLIGNLFLTFSLMLLVIFLQSCATVKIPVKVTHPAEIDMRDYNSVVVEKMGGSHGADFSSLIKEKIIESERFQILDRERMAKIRRELEIAHSDTSDEASAKRLELGKQIAASAIISGTIDGDYDEQMISERRTCSKYNPKTKKSYKYPCTYRKRIGVFSLAGSVDIINVETTEIIKTKRLNASYKDTESATDATPQSIDKNALYSRCMHKAVNDFVKTIMPWTETVMARFRKCKDIPVLEQGINQARIGEMDEAIKIFRQAGASAEANPKIKPDKIAIAYWNLGLAYEYSWQFDKALKALKKAYSLSPKQEFANEMTNVKKLKAERKKLEKQKAL